ncbi:hypothetical protein LENED_004829 [Lentinula edodes]|uniref:Uncharacterized protein n=1 Tax=Lentinula edodes TaxID=5353 RepID=A0A1Q3E7C2_LENED|nr:hypothetical protein LENED_004829 [Lentinula edodes]
MYTRHIVLTSINASAYYQKLLFLALDFHFLHAVFLCLLFAHLKFTLSFCICVEISTLLYQKCMMFSFSLDLPNEPHPQTHESSARL